MITEILSIGGKLIDKLLPDPKAKAEAKLKLVELQQSGDLDEVKASLSAIVMEAQSKDPWTSRARPSFMYVMYIMILGSIPMGLIHAYDPAVSSSISTGVTQWLSAIPEEMWWLFGTGYLGYTGFRSHDKKNMLKAKS